MAVAASAAYGLLGYLVEPTAIIVLARCGILWLGHRRRLRPAKRHMRAARCTVKARRNHRDLDFAIEIGVLDGTENDVGLGMCSATDDISSFIDLEQRQVHAT